MTLKAESGLSPQEILELEPEKCIKRLDQGELEAIFIACNALWRHPGDKNPQAPHAVLTSGKHSNIYINCNQVLQHSNLCQIMAYQMLELLRIRYFGPVDWVVGSDSAALGISKDIANLAKAKWHPMQKGPNGTQIWEKGNILPGERVLHVEELLTTGQTAKEVRKAINWRNPYPVEFVPFIPVLVHRPDQSAPEDIDRSKLIHILHYDTYTVDPEEKECELCRQGSPALPAKENWRELMNTM